MSKLLLVRHGDTEFNSARRFQGHSDIELSTAGYRQAERLRDRLATEEIDIIYSSDLKRALVTAELISSKHKVSLVTCPELREINYGKLEGLIFEEISRLYPEIADRCVNWSLRLEFPSGESFAELEDRVSKFLNRLEKHKPGQTILIVAHGGPLQLMVCYLLGIELRHWQQIRLDNASLSIVDIYPEAAIISLLNDTSHLK